MHFVVKEVVSPCDSRKPPPPPQKKQKNKNAMAATQLIENVNTVISLSFNNNGRKWMSVTLCYWTWLQEQFNYFPIHKKER